MARPPPKGEKRLDPDANKDNRGFTGHIDDDAPPLIKGGLTYMQARYYDPIIGRFLSNDPVPFTPAMPQMFNRYSYTLNDPVNLIDPFGLAASSPGKPTYDWCIHVGSNSFACGNSSSGAGLHLSSSSSGQSSSNTVAAGGTGTSSGTGTTDGNRTSSSETRFRNEIGRLGRRLFGVFAIAGHLKERLSPTLYKHYTSSDAAEKINASGLIRQSSDGFAYLTTDSYSTNDQAQSSLALARKPDGVLLIWSHSILPPYRRPDIGPRPVTPANDQNGGGSEVLYRGGLQFRPGSAHFQALPD